MDEQQAVDIFDSAGAILRGHYALRGRKHSGHYVQKRRIYAYTEKLWELCEAIAAHFLNYGIQVVVAPASGGLKLNFIVAHILTKRLGYPVFNIDADKKVIKTGGDTSEIITIQENLDLLIGRRILVVDDIGTTATPNGSLARSVQATRDVLQGNGEIVAASLLWNRGNLTSASVGVPELLSLASKRFPAWEPHECPLCQEGLIPVDPNIGRGKEWYELQKQ
jgi:orotate phosphoribosyltransferase